MEPRSMSEHRFVLPRPVPRSPEELAKAEAFEKAKAVLLHVMKHGITIRPWLVTRDGEIVGDVPDSADEQLMTANRIYKESQNAKVHTSKTNPAA
jgi:hypothetical protein